MPPHNLRSGGASNVFATPAYRTGRLKPIEKAFHFVKKLDDMGRKKISEKDKRRVQVNIRLTDEEFEKIYNIFNWQRSVACELDTEESSYGKFPPPKISPIDSAAIQELRRIGVNLNQAMHKVNVGLLSSALFLTLVELKKKINDLIGLINNDGKSD